jgi:bifunctional UDP-N-acetylglucosamine pyrophosphorylase / glucosamine-1-phosphate N-acetyltransferase
MTSTSERPSLAIILAAGQGTRMKSARPKVMHEVAQRPMAGHVLAAAQEAGITSTAIVIAPHMQNVAGLLAKASPQSRTYIQAEQLGTAHAVLSARPALQDFAGDVLVLYGDTPLITPETLTRLRQCLTNGAAVAVLGFEARDPSGYGRLILDASGRLTAIREEKDATPAERAITLCNSGVIGFRGEIMLSLLGRIGNSNAKGEYYLTDAIALASADGLATRVIVCPEEEVEGVNDRAQLAAREAAMQARLRRKALDGGATLIAPDSVTLAYDTQIGKDVLIEPNVFFGPGVTVGDGCHIKAFCHLEGAQLGEGCEIGPFARLRPGTRLARKVRAGNFVELKNAVVDDGAKVNHLTYIGDAHVGAGANIGAGTITCNYDGFDKHHTEIGARAFIGSNSSLIAPVTIGGGAYVGSGSVITSDVAPDALAVARPPQVEKAEWAAKMRARRTRDKPQHG